MAQYPKGIFIEQKTQRYYYRYTNEQGKRKAIKLTPVSDGLEAMEQARAAAISELQLPSDKKAEQTLNGFRKNTLGWLLERYITSTGRDSFAELAVATRKQQTGQAIRLQNYRLRLKSGKKVIFGNVLLSQIDSSMLKDFRHQRENSDGKGVSANRELALISRAWSWGIEEDLLNLPYPKVRKVKEQHRTRLVSDDELRLFYEIVAQSDTKYLKDVCEFVYLCRLRQAEVLALTMDDLYQEGILSRRLKGSKTTINEWTERLGSAVASCCDRHPPNHSGRLVLNDHGKAVAGSGINSGMRRRMAEFVAAGGEHFRLHDLKAKGITQTDPHLRKLAGGHKTDSASMRYQRGVDRVKATR